MPVCLRREGTRSEGLISKGWIWVVAFCVFAPSTYSASYSIQLQPGFNSIANHLVRGANRIEEVIPNVPEESQLWKFNPATQSYYEQANFLNGQWLIFVPEMERLNPGEGAFLWVDKAATLTFAGAIGQFSLPRPVAFGGYNFVSAHQPRDMKFVELFGFEPHPGDVVYLYDKPFAALPHGNQQQASSIHRFTLRGWDFVPTFRLGRAAFVYLSQGPRIVQQPPVSQTTNAGQTVRFDVSAIGPGPYRYQWLFNEDDLPGETNSFLSIKSVQYWHNGLYSVSVRNPYGEATSRPAFLRVNSRPVILEQPQPIQTVPGRQVEFRVRAVGNPVLRYQWFYNNQLIPSATGPELVIQKPEQQPGQYFVRVTNHLGFALSQAVPLTIVSPPKIVREPDTRIARLGENVVFSVGAEGPQLSYHWRHNGQRIERGSNATLVLEGVQLRDAGTYDVVVVNAGDAAYSAFVDLILGDLPIIDFKDSPAEAPFFTETRFTGRGDNRTATNDIKEIRCGREGGSAVWMRWLTKERGIVRFETSGSGFDTVLAAYAVDAQGLTEVACDDDDGETYGSRIRFVALPDVMYFIAIDGVDAERGQIVLDWEFVPTDEMIPIIHQQPRDQTVGLGPNETAVFFVEASGAPGTQLSYQWYFNGNPILDANEPQLRIFRVTEKELGYYQVIVGQGQQFVRSRPARLQVSVSGIDNVLVHAFAVDKFADAVLRGPRLAPAGGGIQSVATTIPPPTPVFGYTGTQIFSTVSYKNQLGELSHCTIPGGASAWFVLVATNNGQLYLNTAGSSFNTVLAVYTGPGPTLASLTAVECDDDSGPGTTSALDLPVIKNGIYYIAVDGRNGASGSAHLNYRLLIPTTLTNTTKPNDTLCTFHITATPSYPFTIERCAGLSGWTPVWTSSIASSQAFYLYSDTNATVQKRFYRVIQRP